MSDIIPQGEPQNRRQDLVNEVLSRFESMKQERQRYEDLWEDIAEHVLPRVADITTDSRDSESLRLAHNYDSTGRSAVRLWANGMQGYMTPRNSPWVRVSLQSEQNRGMDGVRAYLQEVTQALLEGLRQSNFYDALGPVFENGVTLGTAGISVTMDEERQTLVYVPRHPKQVYIAENHLGRVDTVYTVEEMTWKQILQRFGEEPFDSAEIEAATRGPYEFKKVLHAVFPRTDRLEHKIDSLNKKYASLYILLDNPKMLRESGFDNLRDIVWRYRVGPGVVYGTSPSHDALIDVLRAEKISETMLRAADLSVRPPLMYPAELGGKINLNPHGMTPYYDPRRQIQPMMTVGNYPYGLDREQAIQEAIRNHYHIDFWLMLSNSQRQKTAYEVSQIAGEKAAVMGTEIGRVESELLDPLLNVSVKLLQEMGMVPEPPEEIQQYLQGAHFRYDGPLAQLQRRHYGQQNILQMLSQVTMVAQVFPQALDWINEDTLMKEALETLEAPQDIIRRDAEVKNIREQRAQAQAQQAQMQQAAQQAEVQKMMGEAQQAVNKARGGM